MQPMATDQPTATPTGTQVFRLLKTIYGWPGMTARTKLHHIRQILSLCHQAENEARPRRCQVPSP